MDILAHALWAGAGVALLRRYRPVDRRTLIATVALAVLPDVVQIVPLLGWAIAGGGSAAALYGYAVALPGQGPALPPLVALAAHHLHCVMHSALVEGAVTLLSWRVMGSLWLPLLGWWSHVVIDVFTHSADFYPSPVLYPLTQRGFDGLAWNTPWFIAANYAALAAACGLLIQRNARRRRLARMTARRSSPGSSQ